MARIHFMNLDPTIKWAVQNRQYNEEEIIELNNQRQALVDDAVSRINETVAKHPDALS